MYRLITKEQRQDARKAWINGKETEKYKDIEILRENDKYIGLAIWQGNAGRPCVNYSYKTIEQREKAVLSYKEMADSREINKQGKKDYRSCSTNHDLKRGDIFVTSWGYDQTNYDYIVILEVSPSRKTAKCQRTSSIHWESHRTTNEQEPIFSPYGDIFTMRIKEDGKYLVGSYPFCHNGKFEGGGGRLGHFSRHIEGNTYHETDSMYGH